MRCTRAREMISLSLDDMLAEADRLKVSEHIADCFDCRQHQDILLQGRDALRSQFEEPSENFEWKVQLGIQRALRDRAAEGTQAPSGWQFWRPAVFSAGAVASVVILVGTLWLGSESELVTDDLVGSQPLAVSTESTQAEPDLSGAVPVQPIDIDATRGGFGIRTVADQSLGANPHYGNSLYDDVERTHSMFQGVRAGGQTTFYFRRTSSPHGSQGGGLNWELPRATLPAMTETPDSVAIAPDPER